MNLNSIIVLLVVIYITTAGKSYRPISSFGMNKPHLLFHLGERSKVAVNHGFAYWQNQKANSTHFTKLRLFYQNSKNGLYVNMLSHDGDGHIHELIEDQVYGVQTNIRYQMLEDGWEQQIQMSRGLKGVINSSSSYWMTYVTIENTDHNLVPHFDSVSKTPIHLTLSQKQQTSAVLTISKISGSREQIKIRSSTPFKFFGCSMNISQTFDTRSSLQEIKYLIELQRYRMKKRKNDSDLVKWENSQLDIMKQNDWVGQKFVVAVFYGEFTEKTEVFVGNRTGDFEMKRFQVTSFQLEHKNFPAELYPQHSGFLKHILYNLYGGIAFYYGVLYTQNSLIKHQFDFSYSFTPSRLIFPRGFLWDDGFHLSIAAHYNPTITIHVIQNWLRKIDLMGWIGREQIRGFEMGALMPEAKFIYQDTFQMNPPTLILPILSLIEKAQNAELQQSHKNALDRMLQQNFWKIEKWYRYFIKTQSHNNLMERESINKTVKYRWRCKDDCERGNFMGSGLDDYPRMQTQSQISKQHVDLMSWIYFFSEGLQKMATYLNQSKPAQYYSKKKMQMKQKVYEECLDPEDLIFKDQTVKAKNQFIDQLVTKVGYISLFPFFTGLLREGNFDVSERQRVRLVKRKLVEIMMDPDLLLSEDGLRSLSVSDPLYGTLDNYWRGAVWMPINYLVLRACKRFYWQDDEVRSLYYAVRQRLISTVKGNWEKSGYLYQNYHQGKGNRGFPFYGWTSLIMLIITQQY